MVLYENKFYSFKSKNWQKSSVTQFFNFETKYQPENIELSIMT